MVDRYTNNPVRNAGALTTHNPTVSQGGTYWGILKTWTGSQWTKKSLKTYLGGTWQAKPLKRWDGTGWKLVDSIG